MLASVMAKKFAVGANLVVIDIPVGRTTKVPDVAEGRKLAREFIDLGERLKMRVECAITYGDAPVGHTIGPALEVKEALAVLEGATEPQSLIQKSLSLAGIVLEMAGKAPHEGGYAMAQEILASGKALAKFKQIIEVQGGDPSVTAASIPLGAHTHVVNAPESGYVVESEQPVPRLARPARRSAAGPRRGDRVPRQARRAGRKAPADLHDLRGPRLAAEARDRGGAPPDARARRGDAARPGPERTPLRLKARA